MFTRVVQSTAAILAAFVQVGVKEWVFCNIKDICSETWRSNLTCSHDQVFFTVLAVWNSYTLLTVIVDADVFYNIRHVYTSL